MSLNLYLSKYNIDDGSGDSDVGMDVTSGADRHLYSRIVESSSLVSVLF